MHTTPELLCSKRSAEDELSTAFSSPFTKGANGWGLSVSSQTGFWKSSSDPEHLIDIVTEYHKKLRVRAADLLLARLRSS